MPLDTRFQLGDTITPEQLAFLDKHGFLIFEGVASETEVALILEEMERIQREWVAEERKTVNGIPLFCGTGPDGQKIIQRMPFTSCFSAVVKTFVRDPRFEPIRKMIHEDARIGDEEKDGVVFNRYVNVPGSVYPRLGWHTDGLRDLFYFRKPKRMLNVGLHFTRCTEESGGLRLIPGSHKQGFFSFCFKKAYFISHKPDPKEIAVETRPGDLTIHDGRLWHRVQASPHTGEKSWRYSMYLPYLTDAYQPKTEKSKMPLYHHITRFGIWLKGRKR
jgi:ectoine hydroxylase-related dioxygenase (phytanoyl-CoA dioxygenase family)